MSLFTEGDRPYGVIVHDNGTMTLFVPRGEPLPQNDDLVAKQIPLRKIRDAIHEMKMPFNGSADTIIGWGARSVAVRLEEPEHGDFAVVVKPLASRNNLPVEDDPCANTDVKKRVFETLEPHLRHYWYVLTDCAEDKPALLKVSREVHGVPLAEFSPLLLLSSSELLKNFTRLLDDVLDVAKKDGILVDLWGSLGSDLQGRIKNNIISTSFRNVLVEYSTMQFPVVDVSAIPAYTQYKEASLKQRILLHMRTLSLTTTSAFLHIWSHILSGRNKIFREHQCEEHIQAEFQDGISKIINIIRCSGIDYRVVGSIAVSALLAEKDCSVNLNAIRPDGSIRDIDVICFGSEATIESLCDLLNQQAKEHPYYPKVSLVPVPGPKRKAWWGTVDFPSNSLDEKGNLCLELGDIRVSFTEKEMAPRNTSLWGTQFQTMEPSSIAASYLTTTGFIKPEDLNVVKRVCEAYNCEIPSKFIDFGRLIRNRHSKLNNLLILRSVIDYWTGGHLVKLLGSVRTISARLNQLFKKSKFNKLLELNR